MVKTAGLTHIHLVVRDLERSLRFYQSVFGMEERFRVGRSMVFLSTPGSRDLITLNQDEAEQAKGGDGGGIAHFGFNLLGGANLDAAVTEVEQADKYPVSAGYAQKGRPKPGRSRSGRCPARQAP